MLMQRLKNIEKKVKGSKDGSSRGEVLRKKIEEAIRYMTDQEKGRFFDVEIEKLERKILPSHIALGSIEGTQYILELIEKNNKTNMFKNRRN